MNAKIVRWTMSICFLIFVVIEMCWLPDKSYLSFSQNLSDINPISKYWVLLIGLIPAFSSVVFDFYFYRCNHETHEADVNTSSLWITALIVGISCVVLFFIFIQNGGGFIKMDVFNIFMIFISVITSVIGIACLFVPKNPVLGLRISWAEFNETTWKKSNKFMGILLIAVGIISTVLCLMISIDIAEKLFLVLLGIALLTSIIYSRKVFVIERRKKDE